jgi:hypothetical protein
MRDRSAHIRTAATALTATVLLAVVAACSKAGDSGSPSPTPRLATTTPSAAAPSSSASAAAPTARATSLDANALLAAQQQLTGCKAALNPVFDAFRNGSWGTDEPAAVAATPAPARPAMQQAIDYYKQILAGDPNANKDGEGSKAAKFIDGFCVTPDGAKLVGTTPVDALKPVKASRRP